MTATLSTLPAKQIILSNRRQLYKISWKRKEGLEMAEAIQQFFDDNEIPLTKEMERGYDDMQELARMFFMLRGTNRSIVADFEHGGKHSPMLLAHWYSRHRFCPVWNMRKSQLIRKKYREFLSSHEVDSPITGKKNLLIREYLPVHMVLTLPHKDGYFEGERFYARKLLKYFSEMRRTDFFKRWIYGGEYGLEIKKSKVGNGLHIHCHSLCFLSPGITVNKFRAWLREKWEKLTGATRCHFETLYYYKRVEGGRGYEMEIAKRKNKNTGEWEYQDGGAYEDDEGNVEVRPKLVRKKHYINTESGIDEYLNGVMECIKYHFKNDSMKDDFGEWDVPLMKDILNHSRNLRFYSRYGAFYKQTALNFNNLEQPTEDNSEAEPIEGEEEKVMAKADNVELDLINPFTEEKAMPGTYTICVVRPEYLKFKTGNRDYALMDYDPDEFNQVAPGFSLKDVIKAVCTNTMHTVLIGNVFKHQKIFA